MNTNSIFWYETILVKKTKIKPATLARAGIELPSLFKDSHEIEIQEFAVLSPDLKKYVLVRNLEKELNKNTFSPRRLIGAHLHHYYSERVKKAYFSFKEQRYGISLEKLLAANKELMQDSVDALYNKLAKENTKKEDLSLFER